MNKKDKKNVKRETIETSQKVSLTFSVRRVAMQDDLELDAETTKEEAGRLAMTGH